MWVLLESKDGWCRVHQKNVIQVGPIEVGDSCVYFYNGKRCEGKVLLVSDCYEKIDAELDKLKAASSKGSAKLVSGIVPLNSKRVLRSVEFYGVSSDKSSKTTGGKSTNSKLKRPPMTEEEKSKKRILELNIKESKKQSSALVLAKVKADDDDKDKDPDWLHEPEDSQDSIIEDYTAHDQAIKEDRSNLIKKLSSKDNPSSSPGPSIVGRAEGNANGFSPRSSPSKEASEVKNPTSAVGWTSFIKPTARMSHSPVLSMSPSKEELKRQNEELKRKLLDFEKKPSSVKAAGQGTSKSIAESSPRAASASHRKNDSASELEEGLQNNQDSKSNKSSATDAKSKLKRTQENDERVRDSPSNNQDLQSDENNSSMEKVDSSVDELDVNIDADESLTYQLYGKTEDTKHLGRNIYCLKETLATALAHATNFNTVARRLMTGVFIPSKIVDCSVTGQSWHAGGERRHARMKPLHQGAVKAIIDFANGVCKNKGFPTKKFKLAKTVLSGRLVEIKKGVRAGTMKDFTQ